MYTCSVVKKKLQCDLKKKKAGGTPHVSMNADYGKI